METDEFIDRTQLTMLIRFIILFTLFRVCYS